MAAARAGATVQWRWRQHDARDTGGGAHHPAGVGTVSRKIKTIGEVSLSALEDEWQRQATAAAIRAARGVVQMDGPIPPGTPIGRLSDTEWGWIIAGSLFAWISTRAQQAVSEEIDLERTVRMVALDPQPWDA